MKLGLVELMVYELISTCIKKKALFTGAIELVLAASAKSVSGNSIGSSFSSIANLESAQEHSGVYFENTNVCEVTNSLDQIILEGLRAAQSLESPSATDSLFTAKQNGQRQIPNQVFKDAHVESTEKDLSFSYSILINTLRRYNLDSRLPLLAQVPEGGFPWRMLPFRRLQQDFLKLKTSHPLKLKYQGFNQDEVLARLCKNSKVIPVSVSSEPSKLLPSKIITSPVFSPSGSAKGQDASTMLSPTMNSQIKLGIKTKPLNPEEQRYFPVAETNNRPTPAFILSPTTPLTLDGISQRYFGIN